MTKTGQHYRELVEQSPAWLAEANSTGRLLYVNPGWSLLGWTPEELLQTPLISRVHEDDACLWQRVFSPPAGQATFRIRSSNQSWRWLQCFSRLVNPAEDRWILVCHDITAEKNGSEAMQSRLASASASQEAIIVCDWNKKIVGWTRGAERLYGWLSHEMVGRSFGECCSASLCNLESEIRMVLETGGWEGQLQQVNKAGQRFDVYSRWMKVGGESSNLQGIIIYNIDLAERLKIETQILRAHRTQTMGVLAGGIAHDLNNVLAPMTMSLPMLRESTSPAERIELLNTFEASVKRAGDVIRQLLTFARGVEGERVLIQARHLITEVIKHLRRTDPKSVQVQVQSHIVSNLWLVAGDPAQLHLLFLNLSLRAREAMPAGHILRLTAENRELKELQISRYPRALPGPYVVFTVGDRDVAATERVLESAAEISLSASGREPGSMLDLAVAVEITKGYSGFITVSGRPAKELSFACFLPAAATDG